MSDFSYDSDENEVPVVHLSSPNLAHDTIAPNPLTRASTAPAAVQLDPILAAAAAAAGTASGTASAEAAAAAADAAHANSKRSPDREPKKDRDRKKKSRPHTTRRSQSHIPTSGFDPVEYEKNGSVFGPSGFAPRWIPGSQPSQTSPYNERNIHWVMQQQNQRSQPPVPHFSGNTDIFGISTSPVIRELGDEIDDGMFPPLNSPLRRRSGSGNSDGISAGTRKLSGDEREFLPDQRKVNKDKGGEKANEKKNGDKKNEKPTWRSRWKDVSPAIYVAAMSIAFIVAHQKESLEQYLNQFVQVLFSCITNLAIGGGFLAVVLLAVRILTSSTLSQLLGRKPDKSDSKQANDKLNKSIKSKRDAELDMLRQSMFDDAAFRRHGSFMNTIPPSPLDGSNARPFGLRSYSNPVVNNSTPTMYPPWGRPLTQPVADPFSPNTIPPMMPMGAPPAPPSAPFFHRGSSFDSRQPLSKPRAPRVQIPITNTYTEYPLPSGSPTNGQFEYPEIYDPISKTRRRHSIISESPFPDYYLDETPVQEVIDKDKRTTFSNPVKVVFKRREPGQEERGPENTPRPAESTAEPVSLFSDQFASKPYGPPPRRYRGINV